VLVVKNLLANAGDIKDVSSVPGLGRSPVKGNGNPLQYSYLENPMDRGAWWATVHGIAESDMTEVTEQARRINLYSICNLKSPLAIRSNQISRSIVSNSLRPHELQHARPSCPSPTPGVHWDSCPSSQWCRPAISSSVVPFSSCPQSLPVSESFPMSQLFTWGGQSTGVSALVSFLPKEHPGLISFRMDWLDLLAIQGMLKSLPQHHSVCITKLGWQHISKLGQWTKVHC